MHQNTARSMIYFSIYSCATLIQLNTSLRRLLKEAILNLQTDPGLSLNLTAANQSTLPPYRKLDQVQIYKKVKDRL